MSDQVWKETATGARLIGVVCHECKAKSFPISSMCRMCGAKNVEDLELASVGVVDALSDLMGLVLVDVRLDDGMLMLGQFATDANIPDEKIHVGDRVRFVPKGDIVRFVRDE